MEPSLLIDEQSLTDAANDMKALHTRCEELLKDTGDLFDGIKDALKTPAGDAIGITGKDVLLDPIKDMNLVIDKTEKMLNALIASNQSSATYNTLFREYKAMIESIKQKAK